MSVIESGFLESLLAPAAPDAKVSRDVKGERDQHDAWLKTRRSSALERASALSVPTMRDEDWRFTDLSTLYRL